MKRMTPPIWMLLAALTVCLPALAQHDDHQHHSPYADQAPSGIAALSQSELDDLLEGAGMGMARAAELNHYPGPKHVLKLAGELGLSEAQRAAVEGIREAMLSEARRLGQEIVDAERHLDKRFAHAHIDEEILRSVTAEIAGFYGELRFAHLRAHLETRATLSASLSFSMPRTQ